VGGGIAGLSCAKSLVESGFNNSSSVLILEAESKAGGRVGTDQVDGYLLDRGFQVILHIFVLFSASFNFGQ
jgi:phytoene dehydrogenase-like protein